MTAGTSPAPTGNSQRRAVERPMLYGAVALAALACLSPWLPAVQLFSQPGNYLIAHLVLESVSMAVAAMIMALAWNVRRHSTNNRHVLIGVGLIVVVLALADLLLAVSMMGPQRLAAALAPDGPLAAWQRGTEYVLAMLCLGAAGFCLRKASASTAGPWHRLAFGIGMLGLSDVIFGFHAGGTDLPILLGHAYKALAYVMVYRALFVEGIRAPYRALDARKRELQDVLRTIPQLVWLKDVNGTYLSCNPAFERFFGAPAEQIIGKTDADFVSAEQAAFFRRHDLAAMEAGGPTTNEEWLTFVADGYRGLFETTKTPMYNDEGELVGVLGVSHDITLRRAHEEQLKVSASVFGHAREGIMVTDAAGNITDVNDAFTRITGYERAEVLGKNPRILSSGRQNRDYYGRMWSSLAAEGHWAGEVWNRRKNGEVYAELQTISAVRDSNGKVLQYVSLFSDISTFKEHERKLEHIAHYDALTNLPNRVLLADRLHQAIVQRRGQQLAVAFLDLDGFKQVNDQWGHDIGDRVLTDLARRLKMELREGDTLARMGGDEFVAVLIGLTDATASVPLLARLLAAASAPMVVDGRMVSVSASIGVTFYPQTEDVDGEQLLRQADQAMYQAKLAGKNRFHVFDAAQDRSVRGHHESLEHIRLALQRGEFVLYYQPKVNMRTGTVVGAEALIRWQHPQRGLLAPAVFLPVIEDHPLGSELGEWVIDTALKQIAAWQDQGCVTRVSVNVGALQLQQPDFVERLKVLLASHAEVNPALLELEVLETSALEDVAGVSAVINDCRRLGVYFALDDFGTGYSSLTYLKRLPVRTLKIDQSFVRDMLDDPDDMAILQGVIGLANAFHREVIAEGVETVAHGVRLLELGCELAQGYGVARPMPAAEFPSWAGAWKSDVAWREVQSKNN